MEELPHWPYNVLVFVTVSLHAQHISPFPGPAHTRGMLSFGNRPLASVARMRRIKSVGFDGLSERLPRRVVRLAASTT